MRSVAMFVWRAFGQAQGHQALGLGRARLAQHEGVIELDRYRSPPSGP
jgi:hypothetical protein